MTVHCGWLRDRVVCVCEGRPAGAGLGFSTSRHVSFVL